MGTLDIHKIRNYLPHRYPILLIDKVLSYEPYNSLVALKNISMNEPFFQGHFPSTPIMPGVLIIEAMAQAAALLGCVSTAEVTKDGNLYYLVGVDNVRFKRPVRPGDQLILNVKFEKERRNIWKFNATATVDKHFIASAELLTTVMEPDS
ncbi:MAG: 3-hydroxyacyl-ACP dehydratase FabZ [Gammaproteobacteria bacterium]|nr:3-hydroxyacyl-ACP dehydratase FabZ [Gammaproteobacteria bacterium]